MPDSCHTTAPQSRAFPIPIRLNSLLVLVVFFTSIGLLWLGSRTESWYWTVLVGIAFSYVLLTNYALLHESAHNNLHSDPFWNQVLGTMCGLLFPCPYTMMHSMHQGHHLRNRTDYEMFDLYYATDSRIVRYVQWYGILCGLFWPWVPIGAVLFAVCPGLLRTRLFTRARSSSYLVGDIRADEVQSIRYEMLLNIVFFAVLFWLLELRWQSVLIFYACFAFNWSTRQYIAHAFTKRDVIDGAWNLRHNRFMSWLLLHSQYDLNHHRRPDVSWFYLPRLVQAGDPQRSYVRQYYRLWTGPRLNTEPAPESLEQLPLSIHECPGGAR